MYSRLFHLVGKNKNQLKFTLILMSIYGIIKTAPLAFLYLIIVEFLKPVLNIPRILTIYLLMVVSYVIINSIDHYLFLRSMQQGLKISYDLRMKLGNKLTKISLGIFTKKTTGEFNTTLSEYVSRVEYFITYMAPYLITSKASFIFIIIIFFILDWRIALASISAIPLIWMAFRYSDKISEKVKRERERSLFRLNSRIVEFIECMPAIKIFNQEFSSLNKLRKSVEDFRDRNINTVSATVIPNIILLISSSLLIGFIMPASLYLYFRGALNSEILVFCLIAAPALSEALAHYLYGYLHMKHSVGKAMNHIIKLLEMKTLPESCESREPEKFDIEFENVTFYYEEKKILDNISFRVPENSITALVGPSGAGKTTITNLILRFWDPTSGKVKIGGYDLRDMDMETLFSCVSIVFQDVILFNNTVKENIRIGRNDASDDEVIKAAKAARCHEFIIQLPRGYDTVIGEKGARLSGGERQRIAIARAILKDSPILILDEATVYVDPGNEKSIQEALGELIRNRTVLMIAHRLSTIRSADQIIVIKDGKIAEKGKHNELMKQNGLYRYLWEIQESAEAWKI
ncbi:ABC transporter ATP-binding protein [Methanothermobacter sp.]|uniref:ABC transporter ATP-binding protein n=1 Tax=Methanothermobacter sp. TaxID=1884223 RepID=UPI002632EAE8|nr:ABC transporter ATP-binding protein [Methanothermobacter sp.]MDI9614591.1 ABC transporter ATP-binding protein [Methanothermobacter sp.]